MAQGKSFVNWYCGFGHKRGSGYAPPNPPAMAEEYSSGFDAATAEEGATDPLAEADDVAPPEGWTPPEVRCKFCFLSFFVFIFSIRFSFTFTKPPFVSFVVCAGG